MGWGGVHSLPCHVEGFLTHSAQNGSEFKKGLALLSFTASLEWLQFEYPESRDTVQTSAYTPLLLLPLHAICLTCRLSANIQPLEEDT